ncbi:histidine phosphatase family protein [Curtobacterium sp. MCBD17_035]|uniref:histidine phosphatase family protein n=1 Tax=Curtobacterium sp. MCBD17_035 TaxID=2175673 RepID=UPI000DA9354F|nr:histidine phosphatase family protein [Curtobacterium sp. MCBD17_035]WIB68302.1 histidine phosphatase family protein [Curtobacterium sp. MCBD17_035]
MSHYLYLVRHGEHQDAEHGLRDGKLSERGKRQATLIADRLGGVPFDSVCHSPLEAPAETARIMRERLPAIGPEASTLLFDCVPSGPTSEMPHAYRSFFGGVTEEEIAAGQAQMGDAVAEWFTPSIEDRHDLLITHNAVIAWFVREVFQAPDWRWMGTSVAHTALTIVRVRSAKPPELVTLNDTAHLPVELRTGLPVPQPL